MDDIYLIVQVKDKVIDRLEKTISEKDKLIELLQYKLILSEVQKPIKVPRNQIKLKI